MSMKLEMLIYNLKREYRELTDKLNNLDHALDNLDISERQRDLLYRQEYHMRCYLEVLDMRTRDLESNNEA